MKKLLIILFFGLALNNVLVCQTRQEQKELERMFEFFSLNVFSPEKENYINWIKKYVADSWHLSPTGINLDGCQQFEIKDFEDHPEFGFIKIVNKIEFRSGLCPELDEIIKNSRIWFFWSYFGFNQRLQIKKEIDDIEVYLTMPLKYEHKQDLSDPFTFIDCGNGANDLNTMKVKWILNEKKSRLCYYLAEKIRKKYNLSYTIARARGCQKKIIIIFFKKYKNGILIDAERWTDFLLHY